MKYTFSFLVFLSIQLISANSSFASNIMASHTPFVGSGDVDGAAGAAALQKASDDALARCAGEIALNNQKLTDGCNAKCKVEGGRRCLDDCQIDYGYNKNTTGEGTGFITNITQACSGPGQDAQWTPPPAPVESLQTKGKLSTQDGPPVADEPAKPAAKDASKDPKAEPEVTGSVDRKETKKSTSSCSSDLSTAQRVCSKTASTPSAQQGGINSSCQQMNNAGVSASQQWAQIASDCQSAMSACQSSCADGNLDSCNGLQSQVDNALSMQNNSSVVAGNSGLGCQQQAGNGMNPSSAGGNGSGSNNNNQPQAVASASGSVDCTNPVNASQCSVQKSESAAKDTPGNDTGMQEASGNTGNKSNGFNVGDPGTEKQNAQFGENQQQRGNPNGAGMNPMGGGSSSGFNFGAGNNSQQGGGPSPSRTAMNANKTAADVLHGEGSRSGYSSPVSRSIASIGGRGGGMGSASFGSFGGGGSDMKDMRGLDLKQYLPGGSKDGTRRISGANFAHPDINNQNSNMWVNVSNRFQVHCKLQMLYDCH